MDREEVIFESHGVSCAARLYRPAVGDEVPCVVLAHGFAGTREARLDAYAERFAQAGMAALAFDYRNFGASGGQPRQLLDIDLQLEDWKAAVAFARSLKGVDPERVALWGTSFSGGHVIQTAAQDPRVAAVIAQCPFVDGLATLRAAGVANALRLTQAGLRDVLAQRLGRRPHMLAVVGPPGSVAVMTSPDAEPGYLAIVPPGASWRNEVAARIALRVGLYRPGRLIGSVRAPLMVCVCEDDAVTPVQPVLRVARANPRAEVRHYPGGHFDIYVGEAFEMAVADQARFLSRSLLPAPVKVA
jgi:fermentation-respiration switch protein FrsA (DUF1100 family)